MGLCKAEFLSQSYKQSGGDTGDESAPQVAGSSPYDLEQAPPFP